MAGYPITDRFAITGLAARAIAGVGFKLYAGLSIFGEYQLSYAQVDKAALSGGGTVSTNLVNNHVHLGFAYNFR